MEDPVVPKEGGAGRGRATTAAGEEEASSPKRLPIIFAADDGERRDGRGHAVALTSSSPSSLPFFLSSEETGK